MFESELDEKEEAEGYANKTSEVGALDMRLTSLGVEKAGNRRAVPLSLYH
jgi:hypothetical protein